MLWDGASDRLRGLIPLALATLEKELNGGDHAVKVALEVVKMVSLPVHTIDQRSEDDIILAEAEAQERRTFAGLTCSMRPAEIRAALLERASEDGGAD